MEKFQGSCDYSTITNILLKVNAKLNGKNHKIHMSCRPRCFSENVMIMGADVTHPPPDSQSCPSFAAVTASHDKEDLFKFNMQFRLQPPKPEEIQDLANITLEHLRTLRVNKRIVRVRGSIIDCCFRGSCFHSVSPAVLLTDKKCKVLCYRLQSAASGLSSPVSPAQGLVHRDQNLFFGGEAGAGAEVEKADAVHWSEDVEKASQKSTQNCKNHSLPRDSRMKKNDLIWCFADKNSGKYPSRIIFYRDGVSDGQFDMVLSSELVVMKKAFRTIGESYSPKITFLVVQKRHHTRFFPNSGDGDKNGNVPAGFVVDNMITHPTDMDFYLVSHQSIQGTSRPTKYKVLYDDAKMTEDELEKLTFFLCHLYAKCNRSVSYPAPTYYAHHAATRAKLYFNEGKSTIDVNDEAALRHENMRHYQKWSLPLLKYNWNFTVAF
ncbi:Hypothetical predicted protein [Cloeon dipterum]|uniref:Piwi domain-containing protein n=1 Tax=Cloeon dipterum TaxID=197152 RepID=A0A8S1DAB8_9INSE|nr:Hypothetical predicted protein [Cloeon dipterum]